MIRRASADTQDGCVHHAAGSASGGKLCDRSVGGGCHLPTRSPALCCACTSRLPFPRVSTRCGHLVISSSCQLPSGKSMTALAWAFSSNRYRYFCFWGTYPCGEARIGTRGGNFASQCEKGGGVRYRTLSNSFSTEYKMIGVLVCRYETMAGDVARAVRWARDNAARLGVSQKNQSLAFQSTKLLVGALRPGRGFTGADPSKLLLVGHSAGAHLCALVATEPRFLSEVGMSPRDLRGVVGISGPYSVRQLVTNTSRFVRFATYW